MRRTELGKKVFSLVLAAAMTASLCTPAWAEELNVVEPAGQVATAENTLPSADGSASMLIESEDSSVPTTTAPAVGDAVKVSNFDELTQAVTTAPDGQERVILLDQDLVLKNQLDVKAGKIIVLDLQGHNVTASPDFPAGRMFVNNGTLTLRGNGTVDMSAAGANGYGAVNNYGTLVVVDGTYRNTKESGASVFYNRKGGKATFENPAIISGCGAVATEKDVTTTINGGIYSSETYPAVENRGNMLITGGEFVNTSCSECTSNWGYTVRSGESSDTAYLKIQGAAEDIVVDPADTVTIVIQPYLDIELQKTEIEGEKKSFQLDITPMYRKIATTADVETQDIELGGNAVVMGTPARLNVMKPVQMTIQLPAGFAEEDANLYVLHKKDNGARYQYTGKVKGDVLTFVNPNGFSLFTVSTEEFDLSTDNVTNDSGNTTPAPAVTPAPTAAPQQGAGNITYYTCQACGYHDWTATAEGYKCNHCGYIESVKQLSGYGNVKGVYEPKTSNAAKNPVNGVIPQTSDEMPLVGLIVVAVVALLGLGIVVVMKKRNKH